MSRVCKEQDHLLRALDAHDHLIDELQIQLSIEKSILATFNCWNNPPGSGFERARDRVAELKRDLRQADRAKMQDMGALYAHCRQHGC